MSTNYTNSSGNIFADLGFPNSEQELLKAKLTVKIHRLLKDRNITQIAAAKLLGTTQPQISAIMRCRPVSVSVERLMGFLTTLGQDVEVSIKPAAIKRNEGSHGQVFVTVQP
jgi:predicted XRE-type DNA-binding protein